MPIRDPQRAFFIPVLVPLGTTAPANPAAFATYGLMTVNVIAFVAGLIAPGMIDHLAFYAQGAIYRAVTYAFIHEPSLIGFGHLFFNMLFLWIFAVPLESRIGSWRILVLYLICAVAGAIAWNVVQAAHGQPMLGSSAAVWGIMGAYLILWPYSSVRCYFVLLALIIPIFARTWNTLAILFPVLYYLCIAAMFFCAWLMDLDPLVEHVAWSAHVGGMLAGAALAGAAYGLGAFWAKKPEPQPAGADADDFEVPSSLPPTPPTTPPARPKPAPAPKPQTPAPVPPKWTALQEAVILGESDTAVRLWHEQMKPELNECLMPGPQLDLARMLSRAGQTDEAIEALDRLLRIHHNCELAPMASLELARLLLDNGRDPEIIASLLDAIEAANPAVDVLQEIEEMRSRLANPHPTPRPFAAPEEIPGPIQEPAEEEPVGPPGEKPVASILFGDPDDTGGFDLKIEKSEPRAKPPAPIEDDTTPPSEIKIQLAKFEGDDPDATRKPFKPTPSAINATPDYKWDEDNLFDGRKSILEPPSGRIRDESFEPPTPMPIARPEPIPAAPSRDHVPTAEIFIGGITHFPEQPDVSDTNEQPLFLRQSIRYAAILTPGRPVNIPLVCEVLRPLLGLGPEPTHHAILRRRGILAEDLLAVEAEALANTLRERGQSITIVAMDKHIDFGPPLDVMTYRSESAAGRFSVPGQALTCRWTTSVLFAAGLVRLNPTAPGRAVLDLFFSHPRVHLRLWESTMVYPDHIINTARVLETIYASSPSGIERLPLRRDWCFRALSAEIEEHGRNAVRTRSLSDWLGESLPLPTSHFRSQIEYDNFLRWHLMAYHAPKKTYG
ncbi:rhomboid family intramembrane serine protease [bacterium]|nr:rhomboid family intramembrane serine protease [bacterium]